MAVVLQAEAPVEAPGPVTCNGTWTDRLLSFFASCTDLCHDLADPMTARWRESIRAMHPFEKILKDLTATAVAVVLVVAFPASTTIQAHAAARAGTEAEAQRVYVVFDGPINQHTADAIIGTLVEQAQRGIAEVYLALSTSGGGVDAGMRLYSILRGLPFKLIVHNLGYVNSIGIAVFLAANNRYANPNSIFVFHGIAYNDTSGRYGERKLQEMLDRVRADQRRIADIITLRTDIALDEVEEFFRAEQTTTADYALRKGVVESIREFELPAGAQVIRIPVRR